MSDRAISRSWSEEEDALLRQAVAQQGEHDKWKQVASSIPGRSNKACRKRWLHSLKPNVKKTAWTSDEDHLLIDLYDQFGSKWSLIARHITGRTDDACSKRYRESLNPKLKKGEWTPEEDEKLMLEFDRIGGKWGQLGQDLQRSGLGCRNRWRLLERKKAAKANQENSPSQASSVHEMPPAAFTAENTSPLLGSSEISQAPVIDWPPYYPPEAYPTLTCVADAHDRLFHSVTPPPERPNPEGAPFQFSSSSLSAALSDPSRHIDRLPPHSTFDTPELCQDTLDLSPLSQIPDMDVLMSPVDSYEPQLQVEVSQPPYDDPFFFARTDGFQYISPITFPTELPQMWQIRCGNEFEFDSPNSVLDGLLDFDNLSSPLSTPYSTPFFHSNSISPTSSPNPVSFADLPTAELPGSLLFSPDIHPRHPAKKTARRQKSSIKIPTLTRLSSSLPLSCDPKIKPYACGRPSCWPRNQDTSLSCFATSGELHDHSKERHVEEEGFDKPYRCALAGCGKSWKSLNGLQYHLQISTVHFTNALHDKFSKQPATPVQQMSLLSTEGDSEDSDTRYPCPKPGCYKVYRQPSGLRYHVINGHKLDQPTQLNIVPPALERTLPAKAKKMRPKPSPCGTILHLERPLAN